MPTKLSALAAFIFLSGTLLLTGCGMTENAVPSSRALEISGTVYGGAVPVNTSHLYLLAAGTQGNAGKGVVAGTGNVVTSLLKASSGTSADSNGRYYVTTGSTGSFNLSSEYTACTAGQQLYVYATGGNTGATNNPSAGLMAVLGECSTVGSGTKIALNELTTVAAAYALSGFATDPFHISDDEGVSGNTTAALAKTGMANAFANAQNLVTTRTGTVLSTTPGGTGSVPTATVYMIANILANCVQSNGVTTSTACGDLFSFTGTPNSQDTAYAAINLAQNPVGVTSSTVTVAQLYGAITPVAGFQPQPTSAPNDYTVAIAYQTGLIAPFGIAIDAGGNVWTADTNNVVNELAGAGAAYTATQYTAAGLNFPERIAIDALGDVWVTNEQDVTVTEFRGSGTSYVGTTYNQGGMSGPTGIAMDAVGNIWVSNQTGNTLTQLYGSGTTYTGVQHTGTSIASPRGVAVDGTGSIWVAEYGAGSVSDFYGSGVAYAQTNFNDPNLEHPFDVAVDASGSIWSPNFEANTLTKYAGAVRNRTTTFYSHGGLSSPVAVAMDGAGNAWVGNSNGGSDGSLSEFSNAGTAISPATGYTSGSADGTVDPVAFAAGVAIDGSGNVWVANYTGTNVLEFVGAATPVVTPLVQAVTVAKIASRP